MIRKLALSATFAAVATASIAADLPVRGPAVAPFSAPPVFTWTGVYIGAQIGGGWTNHGVRETNAAGVFTSSGKLDASSILGGLHWGYNHQFSGTAFVLGIEGDIEATGLRKNSNALVMPTGALVPGVYSFGSKIDWQGSLRLRWGYALNNLLIYGTGGVAFANIHTNYQAGGVNTKISDTRAGWTLGGGLEYAIDRNWSVRGEYRYSDYGRISENVAAPAPVFGGFNYRHSIQEHALRAGVSYRF